MFVFSSQSEAHGGQQINEFAGYALAHIGKAKAPTTVYSSSLGPESYTSPVVYDKLTQYAAAARERHGEDHDPTTEPLDTDLVMRLGSGKQHGRYFMANSVIDPSSVPTLSQIRREDRQRGGGSQIPIAPRQQSTAHMVTTLQVSGVSFVVQSFHA
jgi:hypothetical protein